MRLACAAAAATVSALCRLFAHGGCAARACDSASDTVLMCLSFCVVFFLSYTHREQLGMNETLILYRRFFGVLLLLTYYYCLIMNFEEDTAGTLLFFFYLTFF